MNKIKEYKGIIILVLVVILGVFYWYELRPNKIKERCSAEAHMGLRILAEINDNKRQEMINSYYNDCLMRFGLK